MSFEQQYSGNDQINVKDRAAETNPQLNLIDLQNGSQKCGQDASRNNGSADQHLPGLSIYDGGDGAHSHHSDQSSAETSMTGGGSNATPTENTTHSTLASGQSSEAGMSGTTQSTASGASESNILQNLQTDLTNLGNVMQQFTTDLTSAETGLAQFGDTQQPSTAGSDNAGTTGSTDSNSSNGASFMQQLQSLMNYLGIPSANNSSSESTAGTPASNSDTTPPASTISTAAGDAPPVVNNGTQPTDSTKPTTAQNNNPGNAPSTNDGTPTSNTAATDPIFNELQAQSPEAAQILSASQPNMSATGYSNFESALSQTVNGGQYTDVASAGSAAALMLQQSGDSSDSAIAVNAINTVINQNGDAPLGNATPPTNDTTTPTPPADTTTPTPPADTTTPTPPADTTTPTPPADTTTTTPPADTTTTPPATTATGSFNVVNGQIIGPDGQPFDAKGVAVYASQAPAEAATIMQQMPDLNFIRLASTPGSDTPQDIQADIQAFQSINPKVVVAVEDVTSAGTDGTTNNTLSGSDLTNEENWYSQIAAANVNNPYVQFGTANEPNDPSNEQNVVDQEVGIYNAVRSTGNNSMVYMEADGGGSTGPMEADPGAYSSMTNIAADDHYYNWASGYSTSVADNSTALTNEVNEWSGIKEASGAIPVIIGEYGDSTDGQSIDAGATPSVNAVQLANNSGQIQGAVGWTWNGNNEPNGSDAMTQDGTTNTLTTYGQEMINYVNTGDVGAVV